MFVNVGVSKAGKGQRFCGVYRVVAAPEVMELRGVCLLFRTVFAVDSE
jgi:hypothetical protein